MSAAVTLTRPAAPVREDAPPAVETAAGGGIAVAARGLAKRFGEREVLHRLDLDIARGEFVAVVGRSGGGKSTLLRLLAGLEVPSDGELLLDGAPFTGLPPSVRMLLQDARLSPWQRVLETVGIAREPGWRERARVALADVGLED